MRFVCDHDVDADVAARLRNLGHDAWTVSDAGIPEALDDTLTVYADDRDAALITHDRQFSQRRRRSVIGWHIWLVCPEEDAADLLAQHLPEVLRRLAARPDLWLRISPDAGIKDSFDWQ